MKAIVNKKAFLEGFNIATKVYDKTIEDSDIVDLYVVDGSMKNGNLEPASVMLKAKGAGGIEITYSMACEPETEVEEGLVLVRGEQYANYIRKSENEVIEIETCDKGKTLRSVLAKRRKIKTKTQQRVGADGVRGVVPLESAVYTQEQEATGKRVLLQMNTLKMLIKDADISRTDGVITFVVNKQNKSITAIGYDVSTTSRVSSKVTDVHSEMDFQFKLSGQVISVLDNIKRDDLVLISLYKNDDLVFNIGSSVRVVASQRGLEGVDPLSVDQIFAKTPQWRAMVDSTEYKKTLDMATTVSKENSSDKGDKSLGIFVSLNVNQDSKTLEINAKGSEGIIDENAVLYTIFKQDIDNGNITLQGNIACKCVLRVLVKHASRLNDSGNMFIALSEYGKAVLVVMTKLLPGEDMYKHEYSFIAEKE